MQPSSLQIVRDTHLVALTGLIVALNVILVIIWQISDTLEVQAFTISEEVCRLLWI